jgi:hypothetical protein
MIDILIRDVPEDDLSRIDQQAARLGLSRTEYLRRQIAQMAGWKVHTVSVEDLRRAAELSRDLLDDDVMRDAWS